MMGAFTEYGRWACPVVQKKVLDKPWRGCYGYRQTRAIQKESGLRLGFGLAPTNALVLAKPGPAG